MEDKKISKNGSQIPRLTIFHRAFLFEKPTQWGSAGETKITFEFLHRNTWVFKLTNKLEFARYINSLIVCPCCQIDARLIPSVFHDSETSGR